MSDIAIDSQGRLVTVASDDRGDQGPFVSQLFRLGRFVNQDGRVRWQTDEAGVEVLSAVYHVKAEALTLLDDDNWVLASDDKHLGSAFFTSR